MKATRDSVKDNDRVTECTGGPDDQKNCEEKSDESEESEASSKAGITKERKASNVEVNVDSTESRTVQNSSIMYTKKAILFYFLLSSTFAIILIWIL